jgi:hypothetical protein
MTGVLAKGALVQYLPTWPATPVVTVFQYNPESMVHTWTQPEPTGKPGVESSNPVAVPGMPGESFQFTIFLDSDDDAVSPLPALQQSAQVSGVGTRLAALEMLLYPLGSGQAPGSQAAGGQPSGGQAAPGSAPQPGALLGTVSAAGGSGSSSGPTWSLPNSTVPIVLFAWNSTRIVPVRVTTLTITETLYDTDLNPTHAQAQLSLRVITPTELAAANPAAGTPADLAMAAYNRTLTTRRQWAANNTASPPISITAMLPH